MKLASLAVAGIVALGANEAHAALFVSGDITPVFYTAEGGVGSLGPGNELFFANLLGTGTSVGVSDNSLSSAVVESGTPYTARRPGSRRRS